MKTPREILFERHEAAEPKLDALRKNFVSEQAGSDAVTTPLPVSLTFGLLLEKLRQELYFPYRRVWIGLAAVWAVILGLNLVALGGTAQPVLAKITPPTPEVLTVLKEQKKMLAQLLDPVGLPPKRSDVPSPRTEQRERSYAT